MKTLAWVSLCIAVGASAHPSAKERQELLGQLIEAHPEQQQLYVKRGATYSNEGQYELALADLLKAESLGEAHLAAFELGVLHQKRWTGRGQPGAFSRPFFVRFHRTLIGRAVPAGIGI